MNEPTQGRQDAARAIAGHPRPSAGEDERNGPRSLTLGTALLALISLLSFAPFPTPEGEEGPPSFIIWGSVGLGILGLVAVVGLWRRRRWGLYVAVAVVALGILGAAPGIPFAPSLLLRLASIAGVVLGVLALVLLLRPASRAALTA